MHLVRYRDSQRALMETPPSVPEQFVPDGAAARAVIDERARERPGVAHRARGEAAACRLPRPGGADPYRRRRGRGGGRRGRRSAFRWRSRSCRPTSRTSPMSAASRSSWRTPSRSGRRSQAMGARIAQAAPEARIEGFAVQPMIRRPNAHELIVGAVRGPAVRPGDPVRPGRHRGRDRRGPGARPAAAQHAPCPRPDRADAGVAGCCAAIAIDRRPTSMRSR